MISPSINARPPAHTEWDPKSVEYTFGSAGGMRITEFMYSGASGEFTNRSGAPIDMTGWSMDDDHAVAGAFPLGAFGVVQPGESVIVTEAAPAAFRAAWNLPATVKVIGLLGSVGSGGNNLARNDEINLFNSANVLVDRLTFGDQSFPGTIRTQNASGQTCREAIGQNAVASWRLSAVGDAYGSFASAANDKGTPGSFIATFCDPCPADADNDGAIAINDIFVYLNAWFSGCDGSQSGSPCSGLDADFNGTGGVSIDDIFTFLNMWFAGC